MRRWNKVYTGAGLLMLVAALCGCSGAKATVDEVMEEIKSIEMSEKDIAELELDDVILRVGVFDVDYGDVLFYIYQAKQKYEKELTSNVWNVTLEDGDSLEESAKKELLREMTEVAVICTEAKTEGIKLTEGEQAEAENNASAFLGSVTDEDKKLYGFVEDRVKDIYMDHALANKMYHVVTSESDTSLKDKAFEDAYSKWSEDIEIHMSVELWKSIGIQTVKGVQRE